MYVVRNRFCVKAAALAACLFVCVDASAQEVLGGSLLDGRQGGSARWAQGAHVPGYMRDSLTFAMRLKGIVPEWKCLPARGRADSVTAPMPDYRAVSGIAPAAGGTPFGRNPYAFDYRTGGVVASWRGGAVVGSSFRTTMPALMSRQNTSVGVVQTVDGLTVTADVSADRYLLWRGTRTYFGVSGSATYRFGDQWSATIFGRYTNNRSFYSMAAFPYMGTSGYGGFVTYTGDRFGVDLGVERYYDTFARRWVTSPIITPKVKVSEKFTIELPVGWMVKEMIDNAVHNNKRRGGPTIMPPSMPTPGEIPFGTPEMPR